MQTIGIADSGNEVQKSMQMNGTKNYRNAARLATAGILLALPLTGQAATYFYTDLNSSGFTNSVGYGISANHQVGSGNGHARLWSETASSVVDLNPSGFTLSAGYGISGSQQVGWASGSPSGEWRLDKATFF